ncbi:uncharacterized protein N7458_004679 [Penicillium daleae]|uniref:Uncharacterized protein n=1 Tax=Penicillium daleae TaxID=63821 RepID=A0AAD6C6U0_9EURO|nr:uncharacterized protein N7458_004679 [Penicillium daleae]KAJ5453723.1 hypothetical protein N7458_004679 [Penicillium daleae]
MAPDPCRKQGWAWAGAEQAKTVLTSMYAFPSDWQTPLCGAGNEYSSGGLMRLLEKPSSARGNGNCGARWAGSRGIYGVTNA